MAVVAALAVGWWGLARARRRLHGTTLLAPWAWSGVALTAVAGTEIALRLSHHWADDPLAGHLRYLAGVATCCPPLALLGAKRPQNRAWQFIVFSLWVVLAMPVGEALLNRPGSELVLHAGRRWFLALLIAMGAANRLATPVWPVGALYAAAQTLLLWDQLPLLDNAGGASWPLAGLALLAAAVAWPLCRSPNPQAASLDRLWLDFRDAYGSVWALRVMERFNSTADQQGHGRRLTWHGFTVAELKARTPATPGAEGALPRDLRMLLLRFVSPEWIADRVRRTSDADELP